MTETDAQPDRTPLGPEPDADSLAHEATGEGPALPRFEFARLRWQVTRDAWLRGAVAALTLALLAAATVLSGPISTWLAAALIAAMIGYFAMLSISARASAALARATVATETDPTRAESVLAEAIGRRPLVRSIRLLLYHRAAVLRHKQGRYAEAAAICDGVLALPLGRARSVRSSLLLLAIEAKLETRDLWGAWSALCQLYRLRVTLVEALQRLLLRTRYEVMIGDDAGALRQLDSRLQLAELMPARQSAAMHALLALAAERAGHDRARPLHDRAALLCTPDQLDAIRGGGPGGVGAIVTPTGLGGDAIPAAPAAIPGLSVLG